MECESIGICADCTCLIQETCGRSLEEDHRHIVRDSLETRCTRLRGPKRVAMQEKRIIVVGAAFTHTNVCCYCWCGEDSRIVDVAKFESINDILLEEFFFFNTWNGATKRNVDMF